MCPHRHSGLHKALWCYFCPINWACVLNVPPPNPCFILYSPARGIFRSHQHEMELEPDGVMHLPCRITVVGMDGQGQALKTEKLSCRHLPVSSWVSVIKYSTATPWFIFNIILNFNWGRWKGKHLNCSSRAKRQTPPLPTGRNRENIWMLTMETKIADLNQRLCTLNGL